MLPVVPCRQWVLSLPWELRLPVARDPALLKAVSRVFFEELRARLRVSAGPVPGARIDERSTRPGGDDDEARALGPMRLSSRGLVAEFDGFNLHAGVCVAADDRDALERLCRYMARPAVASGRVSVLPDGNVAYRVKSPRSAGATHRVMTPMEFMARLAALVPVKVLAKLFRGKLRAALIEGLASGAVTLPPNSAPDVLDQLRTALYRTDWVVYAEAPFGALAGHRPASVGTIDRLGDDARQ